MAVTDDRFTNRAPRADTPPPTFDRQPPQDLPAEQSVLGGMLMSKDAIADVIEALRSMDFYKPAHSLIFDAILDLYSRGEPADTITVAAELERHGSLVRAGGAVYLHTLMATVPTAANAGFYATIVAEKAILRRLVEAGTRIVQLGYGGNEGEVGGGEVDQIVDRAQAEIYEVTERRTTEDYTVLEELLQPTMDEIDAIAQAGGQAAGVPTGFADFDRLTNGLHAGQMIIVAARPGVGKALALGTPVRTPAGWSTMGELAVGDEVIGSAGLPVRVVAATGVMTGRPCFEVEFADGEVVVADAEHQWLTWDGAAREAFDAADGRRDPQGPATAGRAEAVGRYPDTRWSWSGAPAGPVGPGRFAAPAAPRVRTTVELSRSLWHGGHPNHGIPTCLPLVGTAVATVVDPWAQGYLTAARGAGAVSGPDAEGRLTVRVAARDREWVMKELDSRGVDVLESVDPALFRITGPAAVDGVQVAGGVSPDLLGASAEQRLALVQGLMDASGRVDAAGHYRFAAANPAVLDDLRLLLASLGCVSRVCAGTQPSAPEVVVTTALPLARMPRKAMWARTWRSRDQESHTVVAVRPVASVPVRCIQVDAPDSLFLAGHSLVPTHNSTLALDWARNAAVRHKMATVIFSLEMSKTEITMRLLSAEAGIKLGQMRAGTMGEQDWQKIVRKMSEISDAPLFIDDSPNMTMMEIRAKARRLKQRNNLRLIVVDYLQLMTSGKKVESRQQEVSEFSRQMKLLAKELEVPVIAISQLNRGPEQRTDKRPMLSDLRESGSLEQDADMVILVHRPDAWEADDPRAGEADLIVAKHRNGPTTTVAVAHQLHYSRFADLAS
ncbi:replicative DNA helicase [Nakamurella flavida]|uniref:Replicative DNA helicase n=1 Tax=Nakamurella flavida TaxID=363630 RepID=A0A938YFI4_9ACTN|nr:replicative DNA helicase [Nakamurella flavida]MBM9476736.1 replicative DNA helicase [Nakamurella flavida]MDP9778826.1 replicative DNA helicase [Nakamurella flavida]